jgi:hypothetical protein
MEYYTFDTDFLTVITRRTMTQSSDQGFSRQIRVPLLPFSTFRCNEPISLCEISWRHKLCGSAMGSLDVVMIFLTQIFGGAFFRMLARGGDKLLSRCFHTVISRYAPKP